MLSTFSYFISVGALIPTLPRFIEGPLGGDDVAVGVGIAAFSIAAVLSRPFIGRISDERGRRVLMVWGGVTIGLSTLLYVLAESLVPLIVLRFIAGIGEAAFYVGAAAVINDLAPDHRRGEAFSYFSLALFGGLAIGPVIGESMLDIGGYDLTWIVAGVAALAAGLIGWRIPDTRPAVHGDEAPLRPNRVVHPAGLMPGLVLASSIIGLAGFNSFVPLYAITIGMPGSRSVFLLSAAIILTMRFFGARIPDRFGARRTVCVALILTGIGLTIMGWWAAPAGLFAGAVLYSIGHAFTFPALMTMAVGNAPPSERGAAVGTFTAFFDLAYGGGAVLLGVVAHIFGYNGVFVGSAISATIGLGLLLYTTAEQRIPEPAAVD
jgi:MFS family permease